MATPLSNTAAVVSGVTLKTPLGENAFVLRRFRYRESLGRTFEGTIDAAGSSADLDLGELLGKGLTVSVPLPSGGTRHFHGICREAWHTGTDGDPFGYRLVIVPWLALLDMASDCRVFQKKQPQDILAEVFEDLWFSDHEFSGIIGNLPTLDFCVQYDETHRNFVDRLTQRFGICYHAAHEDGRHTMVFSDSHSSHAPFPGYDTIPYATGPAEAATTEHVFRWESGRRMATGKVVLKDYDFENPGAALEAEDSAGQSYPHGELERFEYPGLYSQQGDGNSLAKIRLGEHTCGGTAVSGEARCYGLSAGSTFKLKGHPRQDQNASYLTTGIDMRLEPAAEAASRGRNDVFSCTCSFEAIPAGVDYRPPRTARVPRIDGVQTAVVVGPSGQDPRVPYTDPYGSVRVQFRWDRKGRSNEKSSCWLRHAQVFAGNGWGATFLPVVGCEVVVAFLDGDPDRPLVLGGVYNGSHKPPRELPGQAVKTVIRDVSGNFVILDAEEGKESISIVTSYKNNWWMIGCNDSPD